jgi:predicted helicase
VSADDLLHGDFEIVVADALRDAARSKREMGDAFERMIKAWLKIDPLYSDRFDSVWLWMEWPDRGSCLDTGIDLVVHEADGSGYCAIQCKFYDPDHTLPKSDIDSFFTASGKKPFTRRIIISTTDRWSSNAEEALANQTIPVQRIGANDLAASPVDWRRFSLKAPTN